MKTLLQCDLDIMLLLFKSDSKISKPTHFYLSRETDVVVICVLFTDLQNGLRYFVEKFHFLISSILYDSKQ